MKTTTTIATVLLAAFLVLGPVAAFAAGETVTVTTNAATYSGTTPITVSGTVTPAPTVSNTNVVITTSGPTGVVDVNSVPVTETTGTYTYTEAPGSAMWVTGSYSVNATYGGPGGTGSAVTTFAYTSSSTTSSVFTTTTTVTVVSTTTSTTTLAEATTTIVNPDTATLQTITTDLSTLTTAINGLVSSVNTISSAVSAIQTTLSSVTTGIASVSGISGQLSTLNTGVNNDQTYVLVVAALAAITLVLELAILVRKLS